MKLSKNEIAYLAASFTEKTPIGLLGNINGSPDGSEYASLSEKGIIKDNAYDPEALAMLQLAAAPGRTARLLVQTDFCIVEKYTYKKGDQLVLAENSDGQMIFSRPEDFSDVIIGLSEFFGLSKIQSSDLDIALPVKEMLVLLAMIDLSRKQALQMYVGEASYTSGFSSSAITQELSSPFANGLVKMLLNNFPYTVPQAGEMGGLLQKLEEKGCIHSAGTYTLTEKAATVANNFLIPDSLVLFEAFQMTAQGEVASAGSLCTTAGVHDVLSFILDGQNISLAAISASGMLTSIETFLSCPDIVAAVAPQPETTAVPDGSWQCSCGNVNTGNFCSVCGNKKP